MQYLTADAGNSRIKYGVFDEARMVFSESQREWSAHGIKRILERFPDIGAVLVCSVRSMPDWLSGFFAAKNIPFHELSHDMPLPIRIGYETPETLGRDRIAAAAGAADQFPGKNVLAIDAGTALTIDLVTADGEFPGGNISPGLRMRFAALHQQTHKLPEILPEESVPLIGTNTRDAILAGVVNGMVYEVDNSINSLKNKYNDLHVILTGGDAAFLSPRLKNAIFVNENLVLNGLSSILRNFSK